MSSSDVVPEQLLFAIMLYFAGGSLITLLQSKVSAISLIPYTVLTFLYGIATGFVLPMFYPDVAGLLSNVPPRVIFHVFLPVLIFEGSFGMRINALNDVYAHAVVLAGPGVVLNTLTLALAAGLGYPNWSWYTALLVGSLLSATDPVAVVSLLKGLGVERRITALVDAEAILNDGTAIIAYEIMYPSALMNSWQGGSGLTLINDLLQYVGVAMLFGTCSGMVQRYLLTVSNSSEARTCISVAFTYIAYYIADVTLETSGVLVLFFQGTYLSRYALTIFPGSTAKRHSSTAAVWEFLVNMGNTILFSLVGMVMVNSVQYSLRDVFAIVVMYVAMVVGRFVMIAVFRPVLNWYSTRTRRVHMRSVAEENHLNPTFQLTWESVALLTHGGLRGGVATMLALGLFHSTEFADGPSVFKLTTGVVGLTLIVNATTAARVVSALGLEKQDKHRHVQMRNAVFWIRSHGQKLLRAAKYRENASLQAADWNLVESVVNFGSMNPLSSNEETVDGTDDLDSVCNGEAPDVVAVRIMMRSMKTFVWSLRDMGCMSERAVRKLTEYCSQCHNDAALFSTEAFAYEHALPPLWFRLLERSPILSWCLTSYFAAYRKTHTADYYVMIISCIDVLSKLQQLNQEYFYVPASPNSSFYGSESRQSPNSSTAVGDGAPVSLEAVMAASGRNFEQPDSSSLFPLDEHVRIHSFIEQWITVEQELLKRETMRLGHCMDDLHRQYCTSRATKELISAMEGSAADLHWSHGMSASIVSALKSSLQSLRQRLPEVTGK